MKSFSVLDVANGEDYESWIRIWSEWPLHEVFAHPEYAKLFARDCDRAVCAVQETADGTILLPLIVRPLSAESWAGTENEHFDVVAPYGFGGPYVTGQYDMEAFWHQFQKWAVESNIITAFFRFSPYAADIGNFVGVVEASGNNVIRSLVEGKEGIWQDYDYIVRTRSRRAEQSGITVEFDETGEGLASFIRLYYLTMQRHNAIQQYYFSEEFFRKITTQLPGQFFLAHAMYQGEAISSYLVLVSQENIYYYLAGTDESYFKFHPNQLLMTAVFRWGIEHGKKACVLGGGYDGYDGVFQFKKKFAPSGVVPFMVGKQVFDPIKYQTLCEKRRNHEIEHGKEWDVGGSYFPAYRSNSD